jgi:hypothetical protein
VIVCFISHIKEKCIIESNKSVVKNAFQDFESQCARNQDAEESDETASNITETFHHDVERKQCLRKKSLVNVAYANDELNLNDSLRDEDYAPETEDEYTDASSRSALVSPKKKKKKKKKRTRIIGETENYNVENSENCNVEENASGITQRADVNMT